MKKIILACWLALAFGGGEVLAVKEIDFTVTDATRTNEIGRDRTYDYSPSVLVEETGEKKVYVCGGGQPGDRFQGHDAIYLTVFDKNGNKTINSKRVVEPMIDGESDDAVHACAPTVVKHSFGGLENGKEKYLMYYECAPKVYKQDGGRVDTFTQICLAFSDDGVNWKKYNEDLWSREYRFANVNEPATAVIKINPAMASKFAIAKVNGKYQTNLNAFDINSYGVGHPAVLVRDGKIWLYYYDAVGDWGQRGAFLAKADDGFHFTAPVKISDLKSPGEMRYVQVPIGDKKGFFVMLGGGFGVLSYNYSWDGINWAWKEADYKEFYTDYLANNFSMGKVTAGKCVAPGGNTLAGDKYGTIKSLEVEVFVNEGFMGKEDGCTRSNGCTCYSETEDQGRGFTWQTYQYKGKFVPIVPTETGVPIATPTVKVEEKTGDANGDGVVNMVDFGLWKKAFLGKTLAGDFNKDSKSDMVDFGLWKRAFLVNNK